MNRSWTFRLIIFLLVSSILLANCIGYSEESNQKSICDGSFILIATIDGALTALDMESGKICWSTLIDKKQFVSSSLSELEIYDKGYRVFLVPSLDGALFKYDILNKRIQPLPVDVESLISHSTYLDPSTSVFGGKTKIIWGLNRLTGEIIYKCETDDCNIFKETFSENVILVEEIIQNINAIDSIKGEKKWHFRVVELNIKIATQDSSSSIHRNEKALIPRNFKEFINLDEYKVSLHSGFAARINGSNEDYSWLFQTTSPIIDVWYLKGNDVKVLDPFGKDSGYFSVDMNDGKHTALLFLGTFEKQMFIKKSRNLNVKNLNLNLLSANILHDNSSPVCPLLPSISTENSKLSARDLVPKDMEIYLNVSDHGFYFYVNFSIGENETHCIINRSYITEYEESYHNNNWLNIILLAFVFVTFLFLLFYSVAQKQFIEVKILPKESIEEAKNIETSHFMEYTSRFHQDFELISILGKGGFGVVMDAKNKIDDCHYAVKRICLHHELNHSEFERVLREVKALAKLDHHGIVRYFNAWIEHPPIGWQEQKDMESNISDVTDSSQSYSIERSCLVKTNSSSNDLSKPKFSAVLKNFRENPLNPFNPFGDTFPENVSGDIESKLSDYSKDSSESSESSSDQSEQNFSLFKGSQVTSENSYDSESDIIFCDDENLINNLPNNNQIIEEEEDDDDDNSTVYGNSDGEYSAKSQECSVTERNSIQESKFPIENSGDSDSDNVFTHTKKPYDSKQSTEDHGDKSTAYRTFEKDYSIEYQNCYITDSDISDVQHANQPSIQVSMPRNIFEESNVPRKNSGDSVNSKASQPPMQVPRIKRDRNKLLSTSESDESKKSSLVAPYQGEKQDSSFVSKTCDPRSRRLSEVPKSYLYIQMQLCQRESLRDWLDRNSDGREYDKVMEIFSEIVDAVDYVHNCGLMHRDLKPSNIYFSLEGAIKIGDFGLATSSRTEKVMSQSSKQLSDTHTSDVGTEYYMSPEQKLEKDYDCKTDIYSLGIILFELLVPFRTGTERCKTLYKLRLFEFPNNFSRDFKKESEFVKMLLCDDPNNRPTTSEIKQHPLFLKYSSDRK